MNRGIILIIIMILLTGLIVGRSMATSPRMPFILTVALAIGLLTVVKTDVALIILIFSMLLSPELKIAEVPTRAVVVRIDDILLLVVFFTWLAKMAINKQLGVLKHTPLNLPIATYISVCIVSTAIGIATGHVRHPLRSSFYILKYVEYFMLFFMVINNIRSKKQIKIFIAVFLITCALVNIYALTQIGTHGRTTAPFEGPEGEPNTLGGYLVLLFAICVGLFLYSPNPLWRLSTGALACFIIPPFLFSLSRGSYLGFIAMYLALIILSKKKLLLIIILALAIPLLPAMLPSRVIDRIMATFIPGRVYEPLGARVTLDESASARVETWKKIFKKWQARPILGYGVTGVGIIDTQFTQVLGETGIIGAWVFFWLMLTIFRSGLRTFVTVEDDWARGLTLGFLAGFVGLLIHSFSASTFVIVRIMEPFWFLTAIVVMLPEISAPLPKEG